MCLNEDDKCMIEHMLDGAIISKEKDLFQKNYSVFRLHWFRYLMRCLIANIDSHVWCLNFLVRLRILLVLFSITKSDSRR